MEPLSLDFINSQWFDWRGLGRTADRLQDPAWMAKWLEHWEMADLGLPGESDLAALATLRVLLRRMAEALSGGQPVTGEDVDELNRIMAAAQLVQRCEAAEGGFRLQLAPTRRDWTWAAARIAASFAELLTGDPRRIKVCGNPDCRWAYYDESKNRARRWCDDKACGNLMKVRRFRARHRHPQNG